MSKTVTVDRDVIIKHRAALRVLANILGTMHMTLGAEVAQEMEQECNEILNRE